MMSDKLARMYTDPAVFTDYWKNVRQRTMRLLPLVPEPDLEWTFAEGRFTFGDLFRHLAGIERGMYGETVQGRETAYPGHGVELASGRDAVKSYVERAHAESLAIFGKLTPQRLMEKCPTPAGSPITV